MSYEELIIHSARFQRNDKINQCGIRKSDVDKIEDFGDFSIKHKIKKQCKTSPQKEKE